MEKKISFLLSTCLFAISIIIGGCTDTQIKTATTNTINEQYPNKPITLIVPFSAGGGLDLVARAMEKQSIKYLGQPLIVVNSPGGAGIIAWNELVGAVPDGYTLGMISSDMLLQPLYGATKYAYTSALDPLAQITATPMVMAVHSDQPWQSVADLVNYAKEHPGQVKVGHAGVGSFPHVVSEMFAHTAGIKIGQVPFRGASESTAALLGGHVQVAIASQTIFTENIKDGTIRILATTGTQRLSDPVWAQVPTFKEQGYNIIFSNRFGISAPKELPLGIKTKLAEGLKAMISDPEFQRDIEKLGLQVKYLNPDTTQIKWLSDSQELANIIQETGILDFIKAQKK
jgi:tripartite-type tricarboxylate transporter receptor subunit TctC